jgi:hypothetical protein
MRIIFLALLAFCLTYQPTSLDAQPNSHWKKIGQLPLTSPINQAGTSGGAICFRNKYIGYAAPETMGNPRIFYTLNGGGIWNESLLPNYSSRATGNITRIRFIDSLNGFASVALNVNTQASGAGIWTTTDGGVSWHDSLLYNNLSLHDFVFLKNQIIYNTSVLSLAFIDSNIISSSVGGGQYLVSIISKDGGSSWSGYQCPAPFQTIQQCWGICGSIYSKIFFSAPEEASTTLPCSYPLISTDSGKTWIMGGNFPQDWFPTGDVEGGMKSV